MLYEICETCKDSGFTEVKNRLVVCPCCKRHYVTPTGLTLKQAERALHMNKSSEVLPPHGELVLGYNEPANFWALVRYHGTELWVASGGDRIKITHWMKLPQAPIGE